MTKEFFEVDKTSNSADSTNYYEDLVGDGKRYANPEAAAKAIVDKDTYINKLEAENATFRDTSNKMDSILEKLNTTEPPAPLDPIPSPTGGDGSKDVDIDELVNQVLDRRTAKQVADDNANKALSDLTQHYGDVNKAKAAINTLAKDEASQKLYYELASRDPDTFATLIKTKVSNTSGNSDPLAGSGDSHNMGNDSQYITWEEARKVLSSNKKKYLSKEYQQLVDTSETYYRSKGIDYYKQT